MEKSVFQRGSSPKLLDEHRAYSQISTIQKHIYNTRIKAHFRSKLVCTLSSCDRMFNMKFSDLVAPVDKPQLVNYVTQNVTCDLFSNSFLSTYTSVY
jgi:hypothetical protein